MNKKQSAAVLDASFLYLCLLISLVSTLPYSHSNAQSDDLTITQKADSALAKAIKLYDKTLGRNSFLYTGRVYYDEYGGIRGHQFFMEDYWSQGEIVYEGQYFDSVFLMYDIYNDRLLLENFNSSGMLAPIMLYNPKVTSFRIQDHKFIRIGKDTVSGMPESFYDQLFTNDYVGLYVLRRKQLTKSNQTNDFYEEFMESNRYYLERDNVYYRIRSKKDILKVLSDQKKELRKFMRANVFLYRKEPEKTLVSVAKYYQNLKIKPGDR